jgi:parvulin-like peptidyl-prolyl isomerase
MLVEKRDPRIPEFDEVREKVSERARNERAKQQLEQVAREIAEGANGPEALKALAEKHGLKAETSEKHKLGSPLGTAGTSAAADDAIFALKAGEVTRTPVKVGDDWLVAAVTKRTDADMAEFGKQRDKLMEEEQAQRGTQVFGDYVAAIRSRLEREGKIVINDKVFERLTETAEPATPPRGFPGGRVPIPVPPQGQ